MGSVKEKAGMTKTKMESSNDTLYFSPSNPRLPVKLFLSIMEYEANNLKCPSDIIPLALSNIDTSDLKGTPSLALLEAQDSWEGFKTLMERMYDTKKVSIWNEVELLKSLVKGDTENARHFLLRISHVVRIIKESENELVQLMFLAGLQDWETEFCLSKKSSQLEELADLLNSHNDIPLSAPMSHTTHCLNDDFKGISQNWSQLENLDPLSQEYKKPDMTYSELICDTLKNSSKKELSVKEICSGISNRHPFYTLSDKNWQKSVSTNLSVNKELFKKSVSQKWSLLKRPDNQKCNISLAPQTHIVEPKHEITNEEQQNEFICNMEGCFYRTDNIKCLKRHQKDPHYPKDKDGNYSCNEKGCTFSSKVKKNLIQHINRVGKDHTRSLHGKKWTRVVQEKDQKVAFRCQEPGCFFLSRSKCNLNRHQNDPHIAKDKTGKYSCLEPDCSFQTSTKSGTIHHMKLVHRPSVCEICGEGFQGQNPLKTHLIRAHDGEAAYACEYEGCSYKTHHTTYLKRHIENVHEKDKAPELICEKCPYRTPYSTNMYRHMKSHLLPTERIFYGCILCPTTRSQKAQLKAHMVKNHNTTLTDFRTVTGPGDHLKFRYKSGQKEVAMKALVPMSMRKRREENMSCQFCDVKSKDMDFLERHMVAVHGMENENIKPVKCEQCEFTSMWPGCLKLHVQNMHTLPLENRKTHLCPHCGSKFVNPRHLKTHVDGVHLKIKRYRCKLCDIHFSSGGTLKEHIGLKHLNFKDAKEWRKPENKTIREETSKHEAWEFIPDTQGGRAGVYTRGELVIQNLPVKTLPQDHKL